MDARIKENFKTLGNFYSNPFYYNFGDTLNSGGIDFIYAQTCDAFGKIEIYTPSETCRSASGYSS